MSIQYRNRSPYVYKLKIKNPYDTKKRVSTQIDDSYIKNNVLNIIDNKIKQSIDNTSPKGGLMKQSWQLRKQIVSYRSKRLQTQYPDTETESIYPFILSPKQQPLIKSKRAISQKRNQSIGDYAQSPSNYTPNQQRILFTSTRQRTSSNGYNPKLVNISNLMSPADIKGFMQKWDLSQDEWDKFGSRFPVSFQREKLLGRGGFSLIWLGKSNNQTYAIKQIPKKSKHDTHYKELAFCNQFFAKGGLIKQQYANSEGVKNLCRMCDFSIDSQDIFIFYEVCGMSLGTQLYDFENLNNSAYKLIPQKLSQLFKQIPCLIFKFIKKLISTIDIISKSGWVHSDIKSENILINYQINDIELKLIDYGSSFKFDQVFEKFAMATPEYMCPEMLSFILKENSMTYDPKYLTYLENYKREYVIDIWGVGCVLLEIISGLPLWMSYDTQVTNYKGQKVLAQGLFAVQGRSFNKIVEKQAKVVSIIDQTLKEQNYSGITVNNLLSTLIKGMLEIDPSKRLSPQQIILMLDKF